MSYSLFNFSAAVPGRPVDVDGPSEVLQKLQLEAIGIIIN